MGTLGTLTIKIAATGVTSKKNSPEYKALRERLTSFATLEMKSFPLTTQQELQQFCYYLIQNLNLELSDKKPGSLILTVHCRTLEILERLWEDYCLGHLNEVVEKCFHTDETTKTKEEMAEKREAGIDTISLKTTISREDYLRCKKFLTEISDFKNFKDEENAAVENIKYKNILLKFRELLLENLDPDKVLLQLLTAGVLTSDEKEKIEENPSQREKSEELLMMLATKGPRAYEEFIKALEESHCFLAFQLLKEEKENLLFEVREREWLLTNTKLKKAELLKTRNEPFTTHQILLIQHRKLAGACWRELGIALGIDPGRLESLTQSYKLVSERAGQVLKMWMDDNGNDATVGRLACALIDIGKEEIADRLPGVRSKRPTQCEEEQSEQLNENEGEESEPRIERKFTDDILSLQAEVKKLKRIVNKRNRKQKKSEKLFKKMIEEWEEMKPQFQDKLNTEEALRQDEQPTQPTEREKSKDIFSLLAEVREMRTITIERETGVQQKENEELGKMIKQCNQMNIHVQNLLAVC